MRSEGEAKARATMLILAFLAPQALAVVGAQQPGLLPPPVGEIRPLSLSPAAITADHAFAATSVSLLVGFAAPVGASPPSIVLPRHAGEILFDTVVLGRPAGVTFSVGGVSDGGKPLVDATANAGFTKGCSFAPDKWAIFMTSAVLTPGAFAVCESGDAVLIFLNRPVRDPRPGLAFHFTGLRAPPRVATHAFEVELRFTAGGLDLEGTGSAFVPPSPARDFGLLGIHRLELEVVPGAPATLSLTPGAVTKAVTQSERFTATVFDRFGNPIPTAPLSWSVADPLGGAVDAAGVFTAGTLAGAFPGLVRVASGALSGASDVTVEPGPLDRVEVSPPAVELPVQTSAQFSARTLDAFGNEIPGLAIAWDVADPEVGFLGGDGTLVAGTLAKAFSGGVRALVDDVVGSADVKVLPGPVARIHSLDPSLADVVVQDVVAFTAVAEDSFGNVVTEPGFSWSVSPASAGAVDATSGRFTAGTLAGDFPAAVAVSANGVRATADLVVRPGAAAAMRLECAVACATVAGVGIDLRAKAEDAHGNLASSGPNAYDGEKLLTFGGADASPEGNAPACAGDDLGVAAPVGFDRGVGTFACTLYAAEEARLTASDGLVREIEALAIAVTPATAATVAIAPGELTLAVEETRSLAVEARDAFGNAISDPAVAWRVTEPVAGAVDAGGIFEAGTLAGAYADAVSATVDDAVGHASVTVVAGAVARVAISPGSVAVAVEDEVGFAATAYDRFDNEVLDAQTTWSLLDPDAGAIDPETGAFTAGTLASVFNGAVRAVSDGVEAFANVEVLPGEPARIEIDPATARVPAGETVRFIANGYDRFDNPIPDLRIAWNVLDATNGSIDEDGVLTAGERAATFADAVEATAGDARATATVVVEPTTLASITVSPGEPELDLLQQLQFSAKGHDRFGNEVADPGFAWTVADGRAGSIDREGLFTASTLAGTFPAAVKATVGSVSGAATLTLRPGPVATVTLAPESATAAPLEALTFTAKARDAHGNVVAATFEWSAATPDAATSQGDGKFVAGTLAGTYDGAIAAETAGVRATARLVLVPGPAARVELDPSAVSLAVTEAARVSAEIHDAHGNLIADAAVSWTVEDPAAGSLDPGTGTFTAGTRAAAFPAALRARSGDASATADVTVAPGPAAAIRLDPASVSIPVLASQPFAASVDDAYGNAIADAPLEWRLDAAECGAVNGSGAFTAGTTARGCVVSATAASGAEGAARVVVLPGAMASIAVDPAGAMVPVEGTQAFSARALDAHGNVLDDVTFAWTLLDDTAGTLGETGLFTAGRKAADPGPVVRASSGGLSAEARVVVVAGPVASVEITPATLRIAVGETATFQASASDRFGNPRPDAAVEWTLADPAAGALDGSRFTAGTVAKAARELIVAAADGVTASATVEIAPGPLARIEITPAEPAVRVDDAVSFTGAAFDAHGNAIAGALFEWSVADPRAGTISADGNLQAGTLAQPFPGAVVATSAGVRAAADLTVLPGPVSTLTVAPSEARLAVLDPVPFAAEARDRFGNPVPDAPIEWRVADPVAGEITSGGRFTAGTQAGPYAGLVVASVGDVSAAADVVVAPGPVAGVSIRPGTIDLRVEGEHTFGAAAFDRWGNPVEGVAYSWSVQDSAAGAITPGGRFTAGTLAGTFPGAVRLFTDGAESFATVRVTPGAAASLLIDPAHATVVAEGVTDFRAIVRDPHGNPVPDAQVSWSLSDSIVGAIEDGALRAGTKAGTFEAAVIAESGGAVGTASVTVQPGRFASMALDSGSPTLVAGTARKITLIALDQHGNEIPNPPVAWSGTAGLDVTEDGTTFPRVAGRHEILLTYDDGDIRVAHTLAFDVVPGPAVSLAWRKAAVTLEAGTQARLTLTGADAFGNEIAIVADPATDFALDPRVGTLTRPTAGGFAINDYDLTAGTVAGEYLTAVVARIGDLRAALDVTVLPGPFARIAIEPAIPEVAVEATLTLHAATEDAYGNPVPSPGPVQWALADALIESGIASVDADGTLHASTVAGDFAGAILATVGTVQRTADLHILPGPAARIEIDGGALSAVAGEPIPVAARAFDAHGNELRTPAIAWRILDARAATRDDASSGLLAGTLAGRYPDAIEAVLGGARATAGLEVAPGKLAAFRVASGALRTVANGSLPLLAEPIDRFGNVLPGAVQVAWSVLDPEVGSIDPAGATLQATVRAGRYPASLAATSGDVSTALDVEIFAGPPAALAFQSAPPKAFAGSAWRTVVALLDEFGNPTEGDVRVQLVLESASGAGTLAGATEVATVGGLATFRGARFTEPGEYRVRADAQGVASAPSKVVLVSPAPLQPPGPTASVLIGLAGDDPTGLPALTLPESGKIQLFVLSFDERGEFAEGREALWETGPGVLNLVGPNPSRTMVLQAKEPGTGTVRATAGTGATVVLHVTMPESAVIAVADGPASGRVGETLTFSAGGSSDRFGRPISFEWDFGDGERRSGVEIRHAFPAPGVHTVTLHATANAGRNVSKATLLVEIEPAADTPAPPPAAGGTSNPPSTSPVGPGTPGTPLNLYYRIDGAEWMRGPFVPFPGPGTYRLEVFLAPRRDPPTTPASLQVVLEAPAPVTLEALDAGAPGPQGVAFLARVGSPAEPGSLRADLIGTTGAVRETRPFERDADGLAILRVVIPIVDAHGDGLQGIRIRELGPPPPIAPGPDEGSEPAEALKEEDDRGSTTSSEPERPAGTPSPALPFALLAALAGAGLLRRRRAA